MRRGQPSGASAPEFLGHLEAEGSTLLQILGRHFRHDRAQRVDGRIDGLRILRKQIDPFGELGLRRRDGIAVDPGQRLGQSGQVVEQCDAEDEPPPPIL
jgi:hypothetical protein